LPDEPAPKAPPASKTRRGYHDPLGTVSRAEVRRATKSSVVAGQYLRRTILISPEMDDAINAISEETGVKRMELMRWLMAVAMEAYKNGRRPARKEIVSIKVEMPDWEIE
jgi:hypothetical protein